ncbi:GNAT family N-acetyltransferase [Alcaligenes sp. SDU_A2]|uniref:GNAT family N-acetyltransferase n=1 Tax=Alcaligenes sp. SDU_A2 TaxID=3136634 RepID=UPI00311F53CE
MPLSAPARFSLQTCLQDIPASSWDALSAGHVFLRHAFLLALQQSNCANTNTGWGANFLLMHRGEHLCGAVPLYLKHHSRGEYVFDQGWAQAYLRNGLDYYPKLLVAVPFTPVGGPRLLTTHPQDKLLLARQLQQLAQDNQLSSVHVLFPSTQDRQALEQAGFMIRHDVQFHWHNRDYDDYEAFLADMTQQKRKKLRQDSRKIADQGITFQHREGTDLGEHELDYFYQCYANTYTERGQIPYLTRDFFARLRTHMPENLTLILARRDGRNIASALSLHDGQTLYGRYWGCTHYVPGLHFETCYIQAIRYCIAQRLQRFEGGAQGEHKLSRGLVPAATCSAHWMTDPRFAQAVGQFLNDEAGQVARYRDSLAAHTPFKARPSQDQS